MGKQDGVFKFSTSRGVMIAPVIVLGDSICGSAGTRVTIGDPCDCVNWIT